MRPKSIDKRNPYPTLNSSIIETKSNFYTLDNYASKVKFNIDDKNSIIFTNYEILKKYENILFENSVLIKLDEDYYYRPEHISIILYGTPHLWYLLLFLNKMDSINEFNLNYIRVIDPNDIYLLNEIYISEEDLAKSTLESIDSNIELKSIYGKSERIGRIPSFKIGDPKYDNDDISNSITNNFPDFVNYKPIEYYPNHTLFNSINGYIYYFEQNPYAPLYDNDDIIDNTIIIDKYIIGRNRNKYMVNSVSFKILSINGNYRIYIDDNLLIEENYDPTDVEKLNNLSLNKMNKIINNNYDYSKSIDWFKNGMDCLLIRLNTELNEEILNLEFSEKIIVYMNFIGGNTKYEINRNNLNYKTDYMFPVDISNNYGELKNINIKIIGKNKDNLEMYKSNPLVCYTYSYSKYENIALENNKYYNLRIEYDILDENNYEFLPLIRYGTKDFEKLTNRHLIDRSANLEKPVLSVTNLDPIINSSSKQYYNNIGISITNDIICKGLNLIALIPNNYTLLSSAQLIDENDNLLEDSSGSALYSSNAVAANMKYQFRDFLITTSLSCENNLKNINGSMGIYFKGVNNNGEIKCYIYSLKMANEYVDDDKVLLNGLYKMDGNAKYEFLDFNEINSEKIKKIADTNQRISGNKYSPTKFKIATYKNNIKIYEGNSPTPIIDFYDPEMIRFGTEDNPIQPSVGLVLYNIYRPKYTNTTILARLAGLGDDY